MIDILSDKNKYGQFYDRMASVWDHFVGTEHEVFEA